MFKRAKTQIARDAVKGGPVSKEAKTRKSLSFPMFKASALNCPTSAAASARLPKEKEQLDRQIDEFFFSKSSAAVWMTSKKDGSRATS